MESSLAGKVALVTGGSRGIGRAMCLDLAQAGAAVAVNYVIRQDAAEEVAGRIRVAGGQAMTVRANVGAPAEAAAMVEAVERQLGRLDILVNNAGVWRSGKLPDLEPEVWREMIDVNLGGLYNVTRPAIAGMIERRWGRIVCVSSVVGLLGWQGDCAYATVKAGVIGFARSMAKELARHNITCNVVVPGFVDTDMMTGLPDKAREMLIGLNVFKESVPPEEVASAVTFLVAGPRNVTGHVLTVDGAWSL